MDANEEERVREVKIWFCQQGTYAPEAAGRILTDMERYCPTTLCPQSTCSIMSLYCIYIITNASGFVEYAGDSLWRT